MEDMEKKGAAGQRASAVGIVCNLILAAGKIAAGLVSGLVSVVADGFNNLSDCGSSAVSLVSFRVAEKPADREHPYGHRRAEYVASMIIAFLVLALAVELVRESVETIISGEARESVWWLYLVMGGSVLVKAGMFVFYRVSAKKLDSDTLKAAATDSACDCLATFAVILGMFLFDDSFDWITILGIFIVCASGIAASLCGMKERENKRDSSALLHHD